MLLDVAFAGLIGGVAAVERRALVQAMLTQPVLQGLYFGLFYDRLAEAVMLGALLQLFWVGAIAVGASLPQHESLAAAAILPLTFITAATTHTHTLAAFALAWLAAAPLALAGRGIERRLERPAAARAAIVADRLRRGIVTDPLALHLRGVTQLFAASLAIVALAVAALAPLLREVAILSAASHLDTDAGLRLFSLLFAPLALLSALRSQQRRDLATMLLLGMALGTIALTLRFAGWLRDTPLPAAVQGGTP